MWNHPSTETLIQDHPQEKLVERPCLERTPDGTLALKKTPNETKAWRKTTLNRATNERPPYGKHPLKDPSTENPHERPFYEHHHERSPYGEPLMKDLWRTPQERPIYPEPIRIMFFRP